MKKILFVFFILVALFYSFDFSRAYLEEEQGTVLAEVVEVLNQKTGIIPGTDAQATYQSLRVEILEGDQKGLIIELENDFLQLKEGEKFFMNYLITIDGSVIYSVQEPDRRGSLYFFIGLFIVVILLFGGKQGFRSLLSLAGSFFIIGYFILPSILAGFSPVLVSVVFSILILVFVIYVTHGFNKKSTSAILGTMITIIFTGLLAHFAVKFSRLSGFVTDESVYLNFATAGQLDFSGLLLGAIIIGTLGMLDDIAITQAACVEQLKSVANDLSRKEIYKRALKIGKEHVGALVNTLALAYAGVSLPLLLLFYTSETSPLLIINREVFATEIVRVIAGSIGLVMAVPITTFIAVFLLVKKNKKTDKK